jgi:hypothetical protein
MLNCVQVMSKEQLYDLFQQILNIKKFEHQLLYNAMQVGFGDTGGFRFGLETGSCKFGLASGKYRFGLETCGSSLV